MPASCENGNRPNEGESFFGTPHDFQVVSSTQEHILERLKEGLREIPPYRDIAQEAAAMPIKECGEPLARADVVFAGTGIHIDPRYHNDGLAGAQPVLYGRESLLEMMVRVNNRLKKKNIELGVFDIHRSNMTIADLSDRFKIQFAELHPDIPKDQLDDIVRLYAARPITTLADLKNPPPHSTGGAADIFIARNGKVLYQGSPLDEPRKQARTDYFKDAKDGEGRLYHYLRQVVCDAVEEEGGTVYAEEFWHISKGDQEEAVVHNKPYAIYGARPSVLPKEYIGTVPSRSHWIEFSRF